jgi:hypothetical protein
MSRAFLAANELKSMRTWAYVPAALEDQVADNLARFLVSGGVFLPEQAHSAWEHSFRRLPARQGLLIVEDELATPMDPFLSRFRGSFATNDTDVFHWYAMDTESNAGDVEKFIHSRSSGYPLNSFLIGSSRHRLPAQLRTGDIEELASSVDAVVVGAWDNESVVICQVAENR